jgi:hypothetical protein
MSSVINNLVTSAVSTKSRTKKYVSKCSSKKTPVITVRRNADDSDDENTLPGSEKNNSYCDHGRSFARVGDLYNTVDIIVQRGIIHETTDTDDEQDLTEK